MNVKTHFLVVSICLAYYSCGFLDNGKGGKEMSDIIEKNRDGALKDSHQETQETIDDYTDTYTITPKYGDPKFKELITQFNKQEHRFEIDTCEFKYNDQSFFIGDSPEKIISIFGKPDGGIIETFNKSSNVYRYVKLKMSISFSSEFDYLTKISLGLQDYRGHDDTKFDVIIFRNIPYHLDMKLNDFLELSDLDHTKLRRRSRSFFMFQKECPPNDFQRIFTSIGSEAAYESEGVGHLTYTGDFDPNTSSEIRSLSVSLYTLEDIK